MAKRPLRVYADTSVFGGVLDDEFAKASQEFFAQVRLGLFQLVTSTIVQSEIEDGPEAVQRVFREMLAFADIAQVTLGAVQLRQSYLQSGILAPRWRADALHVALATVSQCQVIVSWNFKHIVHFQKIPLYNAVNILNGYAPIDIYSPKEVISYDD